MVSSGELSRISNAHARGHHSNSITCFCCRWTPESVGDYASGTNHVLPTYGYARMYSGVSLDSFTKKMTVQNLKLGGVAGPGPACCQNGRGGGFGGP